jgi:O-antigen ligase
MADSAPHVRRTIRTLFSVANILPALLAVLGPLVYVAPLGAVPALLVLGLGAAVTAWRAGALDGSGIGRGLAVFAPVFAWMLLSSLWSLDAHAALSLGLRLAGIFVTGIAFVHWLRILPLERLGPCLATLALGFAVASAVVVVDLVLCHGWLGRHLHGPQAGNYDIALFYGRGATIHSILMVPLLLGLWQGGARRLAVLQLLIGALAILVTSSLSAKIALALALVVGAGVFLVPRLRYLLLGLFAAAIIGLPAILPYHPDAATNCWLANEKASALHRLYIWDFAADRIAEHPFIGWGLDAARRIPGGDTPVVVHRCDAEGRPTDRVPIDSVVMPLHPHNAILQVWLELGGIGAALGFGALLLVLARAFAARAWRSRSAQAGFAAACFGGLSVALVSFGVWQEWFLSALFMVAATATLAARQGEPPPDQPRR